MKRFFKELWGGSRTFRQAVVILLAQIAVAAGVPPLLATAGASVIEAIHVVAQPAPVVIAPTQSVIAEVPDILEGLIQNATPASGNRDTHAPPEGR